MTATATPTTTDTPEPRSAATGTIAPALQHHLRRGFPRDYVVLVAVLVVGAALPFVLSSSQLAVGMRVLVFALMGIGWNIMSGYGGMFSFGHAAYFGIGAYSTAYFVAVLGLSPWLGMLCGMALAAVAGVGISYLALRYKLQGAYFALSTFAFAEMLRLFVTGNETLRRTIGFSVPVQAEESIVDFQFRAGSPMYFWIGLALVGLALLVSIVFVRSRAGRFTMAVRDDDVAAAALGVPVLRRKLTAVAISAAITSVAGMLYVQNYMFIDPDLAFDAAVSNNAIITAVVGGAGTIWGPLVGAVVMGPLSDLVAGFTRNPPEALAFLSGHSGLDIVIYAVVLIVVVTVLPHGIYGTIVRKVRRR